MKHAILLKSIAFSCVAAITFNSNVDARTLNEIKTAGTIIMATEGAYPPFNYFQGSQLTGFEVELGNAIAKKMGLKVVWQAKDFTTLLSGLSTDRWDVVVASFGINDQRATQVSFTQPHYCSGAVIVSRNISIKTSSDLVGKVVATQTGTTYFEQSNKVSGVQKLYNFPQDGDALGFLLNGRADAWVTDAYVAKAANESRGNSLTIGDFLFTERTAAAVKKGNSSLADAYNKALTEVMADGTYQALSQKYLKQDSRCK